jgi:hypothetical protein
MGFFDRLFGREEQSNPPVPPSGSGRSEDEIAVERYAYLLRTAPPETIEQVHTEAFSKLTQNQRDILFDRLTQNVAPSERPTDTSAATLAKVATRAELQQPGILNRTLGGSSLSGVGGPSFGSMFGGSLLGSIAGYVIGSALVSAFFPMDYGSDAGTAGVDQGSDSSWDATDASAAVFDSNSSGYDGGDAGGFGGGDFGGGDFGGGDF